MLPSPPVPPVVATRSAWKNEPLPEPRAALPYERTFAAGEYERVKRGLVPEKVDDKWFVFFEAPWVFFHRRFTGFCIYAVELREEGEGAVVASALANRAPEEYRETDPAHDARILAFLVDRLLLGLPATFPIREGFPAAKASLLVHHVVGHGRSSDES